MKVLRTALLTLGISILIFFSGSLLISQTFFVQRSVFVGTSDTTAFKFAQDYTHFNKWNPWYETEPHANYQITGTPGVAGHTFLWNGKNIGKVKFEYITHEPYKAIYQKITFDSSLKGSFVDNMYFHKTYKGTIVTWTFSGESRTLLEKWKSLLYDDFIGDDYQKGLDKFKEELENPTFSKAGTTARESAKL